MMNAQVHRGPDDAGEYHDEDVRLGFRRLSVIDLETGQQPFRYEDDRAVLVMNGEIYNFRELRAELEPRNAFRSKGDAEVVLRLLVEQGPQAIQRLDGMFAFAFWDKRARTLTLARDRYGIKPLFYVREGSRWVFSSEMNSLLTAGYPRDRTIEARELGLYLAQQYVSPGGTLFRDAAALEPAEIVQISPQGEKRWKYWSPPTQSDETISYDDAVRKLAVMLDEAVDRQSVADVPVGVFLSGGVDSGTLAALFSKQVSGTLQTFSVGFDDVGAVSEVVAAQETAKALGTHHHELIMSSAQVRKDMPSILRSLDGPQGDATAIPTWYVSKLARENVTVALAGEGADEIFGGYDRQRRDILLDRLGPLARLIPVLKSMRGGTASAALKARVTMPRGLPRLLDWSQLFDKHEMSALLEPAFHGAADHGSLWKGESEHFDRRAASDPVAARMDADLLGFLPCDLLPKVDRMSMAHSLEVRVPFLDNALVDFALGLPGKLRIRGRVSKPLLRDAAARVLPPPLSTRPKQGFDVPIGSWLRGPLEEPMRDLLLDQTARERGWFVTSEVEQLVKRHIEGGEDCGQQLWTLFALEGWWRN
jgi:asparagine synthase (glutamine-hydrolysing)